MRMRDQWFKGLVQQGFASTFEMLKGKVAGANMKPIYDSNGLLKIPFSIKQSKGINKGKNRSNV